MQNLLTRYNRLFISCICLSLLFLTDLPASAEILSADLSVITSADPQSNQQQSFVIINPDELVQQGIKNKNTQTPLGPQTPFVIEYKKPLQKNQQLRWEIKVADNQYGTIRLLSRFPGKGRLLNSGYFWQSAPLDYQKKNRQRLVFRPQPFAHQPKIYKKGKGRSGKRQKYGGGTLFINDEKFNPQLKYTVSLNILHNENVISRHQAIIEMDKKDMIRQEYINHYNIKRYGRGENGNLPVPARDEISEVSSLPEHLQGNPLTESQYQLIIDDGISSLARKINSAYLSHIEQLKKQNSLKDLNHQPLDIPESKLWLSSGWRNPERNEWYSNAVNGIHQRGGAVDFIIMAPANSYESSIAYWILWQALEASQHLNAFWQLEVNGRPMTTREFNQDIEPENGIPDAFDKADHLHANIIY